MKNNSVLIVDLALTQAIEQYMEMLPHEAYNSIMRDWPEQIATLLFEFMFRAGGHSFASRTTDTPYDGIPHEPTTHVFTTTSRHDDNTLYITCYEKDSQ